MADTTLSREKWEKGLDRKSAADSIIFSKDLKTKPLLNYNKKYNLKIFQCLEFGEVPFMRLIKIFFAISITFLMWFQAELFSQTEDGLSKQRGTHLLVQNKKTGKEEIIKLYKKIYAVVIGIDLYENLSPDRHLRYAVRDAKGMEKLLKERFAFDEIFSLYNREATRERIMALLLGKISQIGPDDAVFIFFAGHGHTAATKYGELGYLLPYNGSFEKDELYKNISMTQLKEDLSKRIPAKHVFYMVDACYSGLLVKRGKGVDSSRNLNYLRKITGETARQVLTAGGMGEEVLDGGPLGHSVFVGRIIQILKETSDYITAKELYIQVREKVFSDANAMGHIQTPAFGKFFGLGDFVFVPRIDRRLQEVQSEIVKFKSQLEEIEQQKKDWKKLKKKKEIMEAQLKAEELNVKLVARKIAQERLQKEKDRKKRLEAELKRIAQEESQKKMARERQKAEALKQLNLLRQKIAEENAQLKNMKSKMISIEAARKEKALLDIKIENITTRLSQEKKKALSTLREDYNPIKEKLKKAEPQKGQFETTPNFIIKLKKYQKRLYALNKKFKSEYQGTKNKYDLEIANLTKSYKDRIKELTNNGYQTDEVKMSLLKYDADKKLYYIKLEDNIDNTWLCTLNVNSELAKRLYDGKEFLTIKVFYKDIYDMSSLTKVILIKPIRSVLTIYGINNNLRSMSKVISRNEIKTILKRDGFFDKKMNNTIDFPNLFELKEVYGDKVVVDNMTKLMWYHPDTLSQRNFSDAKGWIKQLNRNGYAGYHDWRLPTVEEGASLLESNKNYNNLHIDPMFSRNMTSIWTTDSQDDYKIWIWTVDFKKGEIFLRLSMGTPYICPVRSMK
jgi:uncharacterized caspase-like protein